MTKTLIVIHNVETDEIIEREMTSEEFQIYEMEQQAEADRKFAKAKAETDKTTAQSKLAALGLTADDLKALGL